MRKGGDGRRDTAVGRRQVKLLGMMGLLSARTILVFLQYDQYPTLAATTRPYSTVAAPYGLLATCEWGKKLFPFLYLIA